MTTIDAKTGSSFKLWNRRLDGDTLTRGQILQFCHSIAAGGMGYEIGGAKTNLTHDEASNLLAKFERRLDDNGGYRLTADHQAFGLNWLRDNPKLARAAGVPVEAVEGFLEFRWVDYVIVNENWYNGRGYVSIIPVWRVFYSPPDSNEIKTVDYSRADWRSVAR